MRFFLGLLLGIAAGIVIGLLVAPQSGEATIAQLREQGIPLDPSALNEGLRARANDALTQGRDLYNRTKIELTNRYGNARSGNL